MPDVMPADVLIFEDWQAKDHPNEPDEVQQIAEWFGLNEPWFHQHHWRWRRASVFPRRPPPGVPDPDAAKQGFTRVKSEIGAADPLLVVFDYLLSGEEGSQPYNGLEFANWCKAEENWPSMGVIMVTTGYLHIASQAELDKLKRENKWPLDYAWVKPWSRGVTDTHKKVSHWVRELMENEGTWRPSQHRP
jgi:hypothetical protein